MLISTGFSKMSAWFLIAFMKPSRRFTAFGSARSPTRMSGCSFLPVALNFSSPSTAIASTARRATASLSATTMMPLLRSDGGRLKVAIGTSASCARADEHGLGIAVVGGQDDAVGALRDAVLDLLELAVGVLAAVQLDDLDAVLLQRRHDRLVPGAPRSRSTDPGTRSRPSCPRRGSAPRRECGHGGQRNARRIDAASSS